MHPTERLHELGGIATRGTLLRSCDRADLDRAVAVGDVVRVARGRYALALVDEATRAVARTGGAIGLSSAALRHGWPVLRVPSRPQVVVSRGHRVGRGVDVDVHRAELAPHEVEDGVTTPEVTLAHCLRRLPLDEALAVADSALRAGVPDSVLRRIADEARGPGAPQMRRVAACASGLAANPFESALRAVALDVPGLAVVPQVVIHEPGLVARPDLVDVDLRIVIEADSFEWHGGRQQLSDDARRYDLLTVHGWVVLRFAWEHVMQEPGFVREVLLAAVARAELLREVRGGQVRRLSGTRWQDFSQQFGRYLANGPGRGAPAGWPGGRVSR